ncbi:unnamed protein product [Camellia sinensis]
MWGLGGMYCCGRKEGGKVEGLVVVFVWMSSQDRHLNNYVQLYSSLGWNSLSWTASRSNLLSRGSIGQANISSKASPIAKPNDSPYYIGLDRVSEDFYDSLKNPNGIIQLGLVENRWFSQNFNDSILRGGGEGGESGGLSISGIVTYQPFHEMSELKEANDQVHGSGRAQRGATAHAMQGWHVQCLIGYGEVGEPIIKDKNFNNMPKREKVSKASVCSVKHKRPTEVEHSVKAARTKTAKQLWFGYSLEACSKTRSKNIASVVQGSFQLRAELPDLSNDSMWILTLSHSLLQGVVSLEDETIKCWSITNIALTKGAKPIFFRRDRFLKLRWIEDPKASTIFRERLNHLQQMLRLNALMAGLNVLVLEYRSKRVRRSVADLREAHYRLEGKYFYLFKFSEEVVIDATNKENIGRLINWLANPAIAVSLGALAYTLGTLVSLIGTSGFSAAATAAGTVVGNFG